MCCIGMFTRETSRVLDLFARSMFRYLEISPNGFCVYGSDVLFRGQFIVLVSDFVKRKVLYVSMLKYLRLRYVMPGPWFLNLDLCL